MRISEMDLTSEEKKAKLAAAMDKMRAKGVVFPKQYHPMTNEEREKEAKRRAEQRAYHEEVQKAQLDHEHRMKTDPIYRRGQEQILQDTRKAWDSYGRERALNRKQWTDD